MFPNINLLFINAHFINESIKQAFYVDKNIFIQCSIGILFSVISIGLFILFADTYNKKLDNKKEKNKDENK